MCFPKEIYKKGVYCVHKWLITQKEIYMKTFHWNKFCTRLKIIKYKIQKFCVAKKSRANTNATQYLQID